MGCGAHVFLATGDHDLAVTGGNGLCCEHDGLEARATHGVDGEARRLVVKPGLQHGLACGVLARTSGKHLAHDDFTNLVGGQAGACQQVFDDHCAQVRGSDFCEAPTKFADCGAASGDDDDFFHE